MCLKNSIKNQLQYILFVGDGLHKIVKRLSVKPAILPNTCDIVPVSGMVKSQNNFSPPKSKRNFPIRYNTFMP